MNIKLRCSHCFIKIAASAEHHGTKVNCPGCNRVIGIPSPKYGSGKDINGFVIEQWLGNGAMGEVHLARQTAMDRLVAVKIMPAEKMHDDEDRQRFLREVKTLANLNHPSIVSAISAGDFEGGAYLAMNFVNGTTIEDKIQKNGPLPEHEAIEYCEAIADALQYAWKEKKLLHRDLKPANFMVDTSNNIHLMDMGIAKSMDSDMDLTADGMVMGTPYFMSPEQAQGERNLDLRSDIYSLGASLYNMVTGVPPYDKGSSMQVMSQKLVEPPVHPKKINPQLSDKICKIIDKLMQIERDDRPSTWEEVIELLKETRATKKSAKKLVVNSEILPQKKSKKKKSSNAILYIIIAAIIVIAIFIIGK